VERFCVEITAFLDLGRGLGEGIPSLLFVIWEGLL